MQIEKERKEEYMSEGQWRKEEIIARQRRYHLDGVVTQ